MRWLTYADRELFLQIFDSLRDETTRTDQELLTDVSEWVRELMPSFGFEQVMARDITVLSRYLQSHSLDHDLADIARGGLLYVLWSTEQIKSEIRGFGLLDKSFVASYAVHEIRRRLGDLAAWSPPRLTPVEQNRAEALFLEFIDKPVLTDEKLIEQSQTVAERLAGYSRCGLFRRLVHNVGFLIAVVQDLHRSEEQHSYARAALTYLNCEQEVIDDCLGLVGYLDDNFVAEMAVDLIEPTRDPLLDLLDATVGVWPFLNQLIIDDGCGGRPISEFIIINAALSCAEVRGDGESLTMIILPSKGPVPFLLGVIAALGLVQEQGRHELSEASFRAGQKVLVDNSAVAEFAGFIVEHGRKMFGLRQYRMQEGQRLQSTHYWPMSDLRRVVPVDDSRITRGQLTSDLTHSDVPLPSLEYLFNSDDGTHLAGVTKRILVVMPIAAANDMAKRFQLYGQELRHVLPMGHVTASGEIRPWSSRFGDQEPLVLFASDLDVACALAEDIPEKNQLVVVDPGGRNANKLASLKRLHHFRIPSLVVAAESEADEIGLGEEEQMTVWEWTEADFSALLWSSERGSQGTSGPIDWYERKLVSRSSASPEVHSIHLPLAEELFESVLQLKSLARQRGDDQLAELDDIVSLALRAMLRLLRFAVPMSENQLSTNEVRGNIEKLTTIRERSLYLSEMERHAALNAEALLTKLFLELSAGNPKALLIQKLIVSDANLSIVCPDPWHLRHLDLFYSQRGSRVVADYGDDPTLRGAIIPGWFRKDRMRRLLIPPFTQPLILVLYDIEGHWYQAFIRERHKSHEARLHRGGRAKIFPGLRGWSNAQRLGVADQSDDSALGGLESVQQQLRSTYRERVHTAARSDGNEVEVPAQLFVFDGAAHAFLTESYRANVVTHLLDEPIEDDDDASVKQVTATELRIGDALLFHRGSTRDVIRAAADKILQPGVRETSSLWRRALLEFVINQRLTSDELWERFRIAGCPLQHQTIKTWLDNDDIIAPQAYARDVAIVAQLTRNDQLRSQIDRVLTSIREVRGAHLRASHQLARRVLDRVAADLAEAGSPSGLIEIETGVVVVRIAEIEPMRTMVRVSLVNRFLEGDQWWE